MRFPLQSPRFRLISGEKALPAVGALVRVTKSSLTEAVRPVNTFTHLTFNHLNNESSLAYLESPACHGPVISVHIFRAWARVEKEKSPALGEILPTPSCPGSQARSVLPGLHLPAYCRHSHASPGPFGVASHVWDNNVVIVPVFQEKLSSLHKRRKYA